MQEEDLRGHRKRLEAAINDALTHSPQIAEVVEQIRDEGFDVFLIIEATIGFQPRQEEAVTSGDSSSAFRLELTSQDERFLRQLKISPD